jgi:hypothetical protein
MLTNRSIPNVVVIPELAYPNVSEAAEWLCRAFGFRERLLIANHRAQLSVGTSGAIVVTEAQPGTAADSLHSVMVRVDNVREHHANAQAHGALFYASLRTIHMGSDSTRPKTSQVTSGLSQRPSQMSTQRNGAAHSSANETTYQWVQVVRVAAPQKTRQIIST